jgi:hypothetical protein
MALVSNFQGEEVTKKENTLSDVGTIPCGCPVFFLWYLACFVISSLLDFLNYFVI